VKLYRGKFLQAWGRAVIIKHGKPGVGQSHPGRGPLV
jgi:hypothetical protein